MTRTRNPKEDKMLAERGRIENATDAPMLVWRDKPDPNDAKKTVSDWMVLKPKESTPEKQDWDYGWSKGKWWKIRPSLWGVVAAPIPGWGHVTNSFDGTTGKTVSDLTKYENIAKGKGNGQDMIFTEAEWDRGGWYPGARPFDSKVPQELIDKYAAAGGNDLEKLKKSQNQKLCWVQEKGYWILDDPYYK